MFNFLMSYLIRHHKAGNSEVSLQLLILLVLCQPKIHQNLHIFSQEVAISLTRVEIVADIFNKKMEPGNRMSKLKQAFI